MDIKQKAVAVMAKDENGFMPLVNMNEEEFLAQATDARARQILLRYYRQYVNKVQMDAQRWAMWKGNSPFDSLDDFVENYHLFQGEAVSDDTPVATVADGQGNEIPVGQSNIVMDDEDAVIDDEDSVSDEEE